MCPNANFGDAGILTINGVDKTFTKRTKAQLDAIIENDQQDPEIALTCTSGITNMNSLFQNKNQFNQNIDHWDVSNVTNMSRMFQGNVDNPLIFNQPINSWNVINVTDMSFMFSWNSNFNQELDLWNVSNVTNMWFMFSHANSFNQDINSWNVSGVENMAGMFFSFSNNVFNQPLNNWDVSSVMSMGQMFHGCVEFNGDISTWDVSNVTSMGSMFNNAIKFNQDLSSWNVSNMINMNRMFHKAHVFNQNISNWDVSNVIDMGYMFDRAYQFNQNISGWDVSSVEVMDFMFFMASSFNQDISNWCVEHILSEPISFSSNSPLLDSFKPNWGVVCNNIDSTAPVITLLGNNPATIEVGTNYADAGASAIDDEDGDLTSSIVVTGSVDIDVIGTYTLSYDVTDTNGNAAETVTRTVNVEEILSIYELEKLIIQIYPNPTNHHVKISNNTNIDLKELTIYNMLGQKVMELEIQGTQRPININVKDLAAGRYIMQINTQANSTITKLFIKR